MAIELPETAVGAKQVPNRITRSELKGAGSRAVLVADAGTYGWSLGAIILLAAIFGLVCAPLAPNLILFGPLRQMFMLFYAGMTLGMLINIMTATGLLIHFTDATPGFLVDGLELGYAIIVASAGFFAASFMEREYLPAPARNALRISAAICLVVSGGFALHLPPFGGLDHRGYALGFFPMLFATLAAMVIAAVRGIRWVRYIILSWMPAIIAGIDLSWTALGLQADTQIGDLAPYSAMAFEVIVTGIAVSHRLLLMRKERDEAIYEARAMQNLSARDPLTGLMNRRAIENRFPELRLQDCNTVALVDLDHFKTVNDRHGHVIGDDVLRSAASALSAVMEKRDGIAVRMGGEEFLLLLRGRDTIARAEAVRIAIADKIAREFPQIESRFTASMGAIEIRARKLQSMEFEALYARADSLLYEAKNAGRDRMVSEKLTVFPDPQAAPA